MLTVQWETLINYLPLIKLGKGDNYIIVHISYYLRYLTYLAWKCMWLAIETINQMCHTKTQYLFGMALYVLQETKSIQCNQDWLSTILDFEVAKEKSDMSC